MKTAADLAAALGAPEAKRLSELANRFIENFHSSWFNKKQGHYDSGTMVSYVLPLALGGMSSEDEGHILQKLVDHVTSWNGTWSGGIINNRFLFDVLHDHGRGDLALAMLKRKDYPSYGYMYFNDLEPAKECMWELPDAPFQGDGMNSRNHHMFSSVGSYLVRRLAGLQLAPGAEGSELRASVGPKGLENATARLRTPHGEATWSWAWNGDYVSAEILVPVGMRANVLLPADLEIVGSSLGRADVARSVLPPDRYGAPSLQQVSLPSGRHALAAGPGTSGVELHGVFV